MKMALACLLIACVSVPQLPSAQEFDRLDIEPHLVGAVWARGSGSRLFATPFELRVDLVVQSPSGRPVSPNFDAFTKSAQVRLYSVSRTGRPQLVPTREVWDPMPEAGPRVKTLLHVRLKHADGGAFEAGDYRVLVMGLNGLFEGAVYDSGELLVRAPSHVGERGVRFTLGPPRDEHESVLEHLAQARQAAASGRLDDALSSYDAALSIRPGEMEALGRSADLLLELERVPDALAYYARAFELQPKVGHVNVLAHKFAFALVLDGRRDEAATVLQRGGLSAPAARERLEKIQHRARMGLSAYAAFLRDVRIKTAR